MSWSITHILISNQNGMLSQYSVDELEEISDSLTEKISETEALVKGATLCEELRNDLKTYREIKEKVANLINRKYMSI